MSLGSSAPKQPHLGGLQVVSGEGDRQRVSSSKQFACDILITAIFSCMEESVSVCRFVLARDVGLMESKRIEINGEESAHCFIFNRKW